MLKHSLAAAVAAALLLGLLPGCATIGRIQSNVTIFHQLPPTLALDATFAVLPWRKEYEGSLEFAAYAQLVAEQLRSKGLAVVEQGKPARYAIFVDYGIDDGRTEVTSYVVPQWGVTGYNSASTYGTVSTYGNTTTLNATTTARPTYGVTGYVPVTQRSTVYRRFVNVDIVDLADSSKPQKVYQGQLKSEGTCGNLAVLMPTFTQVMFGEFPGQPSRAGPVSLPWDGKC